MKKPTGLMMQAFIYYYLNKKTYSIKPDKSTNPRYSLYIVA